MGQEGTSIYGVSKNCRKDERNWPGPLSAHSVLPDQNTIACAETVKRSWENRGRDCVMAWKPERTRNIIHVRLENVSIRPSYFTSTFTRTAFPKMQSPIYTRKLQRGKDIKETTQGHARSRKVTQGRTSSRVVGRP